MCNVSKPKLILASYTAGGGGSIDERTDACTDRYVSISLTLASLCFSVLFQGKIGRTRGN
jgi:hypothetical protein